MFNYLITGLVGIVNQETQDIIVDYEMISVTIELPHPLTFGHATNEAYLLKQLCLEYEKHIIDDGRLRHLFDPSHVIDILSHQYKMINEPPLLTEIGVFPTLMDRDRAISDLVIEYHTECEQYDLTVCTGPVFRDGIAPATQQERKLINDHALIVRTKILEKADHLGIDRAEILKAIAQWNGSF